MSRWQPAFPPLCRREGCPNSTLHGAFGMCKTHAGEFEARLWQAVLHEKEDEREEALTAAERNQ